MKGTDTTQSKRNPSCVWYAWAVRAHMPDVSIADVLFGEIYEDKTEAQAYIDKSTWASGCSGTPVLVRVRIEEVSDPDYYIKEDN